MPFWFSDKFMLYMLYHNMNSMLIALIKMVSVNVIQVFML